MSIAFVMLLSTSVFSQNPLNYSVELRPLIIESLPGLHSYAFAQHEGLWLVIGGRKDGLHARQPFASFPASENNTEIYVIDVRNRKFWSASINGLTTGLKEQLQSTNMNFYQDDDTLYIIGGYAFSTSANDHITFSYLTAISVSSLVEDIIKGDPITGNFRQIEDTAFAVTGGALGKIDDTFLLVGGQKFTGRYNPQNHATFTQKYTDQIRRFQIDNSGPQLNIRNYSATTDQVHLHRRDYNLLPQIFPNGEQGYTVSSGVFQINDDLPFLNPVVINNNGHTAVTDFNQYLNHYHSATAYLYNSQANQMHSLFFGGMSQYYYQDGNLIKDDLVPFVKTISQVTRSGDGTWKEYLLPEEMPGFRGAGAEFIINHDLVHYTSDILNMDSFTGDTVHIGYIYGGILSPGLNPFADNVTSTTSAASIIYEVRLVEHVVHVEEIDGSNPFNVRITPNPVDRKIRFEVESELSGTIRYYLGNSIGQIVQQGSFHKTQEGVNHFSITLQESVPAGYYTLNLLLDGRYFVTEKIVTR